MRAVPSSITQAIEEYAGFNATDAAENGMAEADVRAYFTRENFQAMFGSEDADISHWPWTYSDLADAAVRMMEEVKR